MLCIYCQASEANAREHYLPRSLGGFANFEPLLDRLCQNCNQEIGGTCELAFARRSPEGILRNLSLVKRKKGKQEKPDNGFTPKFIGSDHFRLKAKDPVTGLDLLWQTGDQPGTIREISQLILFSEDGSVTHQIPIPSTITSGRELSELFRHHGVVSEVPQLRVIAASGDQARIKRMFADLGIECDIQMSERPAGLVPGPKVFEGTVDVEYFRALAKIGFHYTLKYIPGITGGESQFTNLRGFIRHGSGDRDGFLKPRSSLKRFDGKQGHLLTSKILLTGDIVSKFQFFVGSEPPLPQWELSVGRYPGVLKIACFSGHFFTLIPDASGGFKGDEIIQLNGP